MIPRTTTMQHTLTSEERTRYYKIKEWFRSNVNKQVSTTAETYILERVLAGRPVKGSRLRQLGENPEASRQKHDNLTFFEEAM